MGVLRPVVRRIAAVATSGALFVAVASCSGDGDNGSAGGAAGTTSGASGRGGAGNSAGTSGTSGAAGTSTGAGGAAGSGGLGGTGNGGSSGAPPTDAAGGTAGTRDANGGFSDAPAGDAKADVSNPPPDARVDGPSDASRTPDALDASIDVAVSDVSRDAGPDAFPPGGYTDARSTTHLDIPAHDPSVIWDGTRYSLFVTGGTLGIRTSANLLQWQNAGNVFSSIPAWIPTELGGPPEGLWAPDVSYFNGKYHVYYAGSTFGSNHSVIGLATNVTLDRANGAYAWTDDGLVLESVSSNNYNAIDPNVAFDAAGTPWLSFGSFWDGIKMRKLDAATGKLDASDTTLYSLASRGGGAIEAPSIISQGGYYYLFVSFDTCCKGASSTYRTMVGRATSITGPYVNRAGTDMMKGGAEELLVTTGRYIGPGGGTAYRDGALYFYVYHYYDGQDNGNSKLSIRPISFTSDGWPKLEDPLWP